MDIDQLVSTDRAAELLGITRKSVYETMYAYDDFPEPVRIGRTLLFDPEALRSWREKHPARPRRKDQPGGRCRDSLPT